MQVTSRQLRAARRIAGLTCGELADLASVHISYVIAGEAGTVPGDTVLTALRRALESCGIEFGPDDWLRHRGPTRSQPVPGEEPGARSLKELKRAIGGACRQARVALALTQQAAGSWIGISAEYYARIERGVSAPSTATLFTIAQVFGLDLNKLLREGVAVTTPFFRVSSQPCAEFPGRHFGAMCRSARKSRDLVQKELAHRLDVSTDFYARIERGVIVPSLGLLWRLVQELALDVNELAAIGRRQEP